jgi:hypothetical protein
MPLPTQEVFHQSAWLRVLMNNALRIKPHFYPESVGRVAPRVPFALVG